MLATDIETRRARRTRAEMQTIRDGLYEIVEADHPMTIRQIFYQAVTKGLVEKTEAEYQGTVIRLLLEMRRDKTIPYHWIADSTRWMRKPNTYTGLAAFIERHQSAYRRDLWAEADSYVEIWCEKEALAGVLFDVTYEFDVPLMVSKGFASESYLHSAAAAIDERAYDKDGNDLRDAVVYFFGDYDPSGLKIGQAIETGIRRILVSEFGWPEDDNLPQPLAFERVAVTPEQIEALSLPTRPTKIKGNKDARDWDEDTGSVELDAIPAGMLRQMVRDVIEAHIDQDQLDHLHTVEKEEREQLRLFGQQFAKDE
jgi:hypothetical protein